jgi:hypothetical protein
MPDLFVLSLEEMLNLLPFQGTVNPFPIQLGPVFLIKIQGGFVPIQYLPGHARAILIQGILHRSLKQLLADSFSPNAFRYDDVFQVKTLSLPR